MVNKFVKSMHVLMVSYLLIRWTFRALLSLIKIDTDFLRESLRLRFVFRQEKREQCA